MYNENGMQWHEFLIKETFPLVQQFKSITTLSLWSQGRGCDVFSIKKTFEENMISSKEKQKSESVQQQDEKIPISQNQLHFVEAQSKLALWSTQVHVYGCHLISHEGTIVQCLFLMKQSASAIVSHLVGHRGNEVWVGGGAYEKY